MVSFSAKLKYFAHMESISPVYARLILRELQRREIDPAPLFAGTALSEQALLSGGDIPMEDFLRVLRCADQLMGDVQLGFMLGRQMNVLAMGPVGVAISAAPNLREGLQVLESFSRLHATYVDISARSTLRSELSWISVTSRHCRSTLSIPPLPRPRPA